MSFIVVSVYYKHGDSSVEVFETEDKLRDFFMSYYQEYKDDLLDHGDDYESESDDAYSSADSEEVSLWNLPIERIAKKMIEIGWSIRERQAGYFIVAVTRGELIA
jgi:hypothetical protein